MKYTLSNSKFWLSWIKKDFKKWYYKLRYDITLHMLDGSMVPETGKGKFVSVYTKGQIIQIKQEKLDSEILYDEVRIIPCQYNHGIMVERLINGDIVERFHITLEDFNKNIIPYNQEENY